MWKMSMCWKPSNWWLSHAPGGKESAAGMVSSVLLPCLPLSRRKLTCWSKREERRNKREFLLEKCNIEHFLLQLSCQIVWGQQMTWTACWRQMVQDNFCSTASIVKQTNKNWLHWGPTLATNGGLETNVDENFASKLWSHNLHWPCSLHGQCPSFRWPSIVLLKNASFCCVSFSARTWLMNMTPPLPKRTQATTTCHWKGHHS